MKKLICLLWGVFIIFNLVGCNSRLAELDKYTPLEESETDKMSEIIVDALDKKDAELLKSVLSQEALESSDLDEGIKYCFELYEGTMKSVKKISAPVHDTFGPDGDTKSIDAGFSVTTDSGVEYSLFFEYYLIEEVEPDKKGVNKIKLYDRQKALSDSNFISGRLYERAGIYNPAWDESENAITN